MHLSRKAILILLGMVVLGTVALMGGTVLMLQYLQRVPEDRGRIHLSSSPPGATVSVDGEVRGQTPLSLDLAPGDHIARVTRAHYTSWERGIGLEAGKERKEMIVLKPIPFSQTLTPSAGSQPVWAPDGKAMYCVVLADAASLAQVSVPAGELRRLGFPLAGPVRELVSSADGKHLLALVENGQGSANPTIYTAGQGTVRNLDMDVVWGAWSRDGQRLAFIRLVPDAAGAAPAFLPSYRHELWLIGSDGDRPELVRIDGLPPRLRTIQWSPTDDRILVVTGDQSLGIAEPGARRYLSLPAEGAVSDAAWSPDGRRIAFIGRGNRNPEQDGMWVMDTAGGNRRLIAAHSGEYSWSRDSQSLLYFDHDPVSGASALWSLDVETDARILLADKATVPHNPGRFAVSPDGTRIAFEAEDGCIWLLTLAD